MSFFTTTALQLAQCSGLDELTQLAKAVPKLKASLKEEEYAALLTLGAAKRAELTQARLDTKRRIDEATRVRVGLPKDNKRQFLPVYRAAEDEPFSDPAPSHPSPKEHEIIERLRAVDVVAIRADRGAGGSSWQEGWKLLEILENEYEQACLTDGGKQLFGAVMAEKMRALNTGANDE